MVLKKTAGEKIFDFLNYIVFISLCAAVLLPYLHIIAKSFSNEIHILSGDIELIPKGFQLGAYKFVLMNNRFTSSFLISGFITVFGTLSSMILTAVTAYPLSRKEFPSKSVLLFLYVFTMMFSGGLIPTYLIIKSYGLINSIWVLILPVIISPYFMIIMKNYFLSIPESIHESAIIDGSSELRILFQLYIPLSLPVLASLSLFYAVAYWNEYFNALIYILDRKLYPLQLYLREMILDEDRSSMMDFESLAGATPQSIRAAIIIVSMIPILVLYPFLQNYFIKGIMIGAVKG